MIAAAIQQYAPFLALDWRWRFAEQVITANRRRLPFRLDAATAEAVAYQRAWRRCRLEPSFVRLAKRWPALHGALALVERDDPLQWEVEARLLAQQDDAAIGQACRLAPATIGTFEALFFHVRDRFQACDWLASNLRWRHISPTDLRRLWQLFAYRGGAAVLETIMAVTLQRPLPTQVLAQFRTDPPLEEQHFRLTARLAVLVETASSSAEVQTLRQLMREQGRLARQLGRPRPPTESKRLQLMLQTLQLATGSGRRSRKTGGAQTAKKVPGSAVVPDVACAADNSAGNGETNDYVNRDCALAAK